MQVNDVLVNEGSAAGVQNGPIVFQSEGAEIFIRRISLAPMGESSTVQYHQPDFPSQGQTKPLNSSPL